MKIFSASTCARALALACGMSLTIRNFLFRVARENIPRAVVSATTVARMFAIPVLRVQSVSFYRGHLIHTGNRWTAVTSLSRAHRALLHNVSRCADIVRIIMTATLGDNVSAGVHELGVHETRGAQRRFN